MATDLKFQKLSVAVLSDEERLTGTLSDENAAIATYALHTDGIVCLENAVDLEHIDILRAKLNSEVKTLEAMRNTHFVNATCRKLPFSTLPLMFSDIWANGPALAAMSSIIGPSPRIVWVGGNTLLGKYNVFRQDVHADIIFNHAKFPFAIATNIYLCDVREDYGSTELWLGSHTDTDFSDRVDEERICEPGQLPKKFEIRVKEMEKRQKWAPPIYPTIKKGSVVVRDLRLWHADVPSRVTEYRMMLGFVHTAWWYKCDTPVVFPESARELVESWATQKHPVRYNTFFAGPEVDHKTIAFTPSFDSANEAYRRLLPVMGT